MVRRAFGAQRGISLGGGSANPPISSAQPSVLLSSCEIQGPEPTCGQRGVRKALRNQRSAAFEDGAALLVESRQRLDAVFAVQALLVGRALQCEPFV